MGLEAPAQVDWEALSCGKQPALQDCFWQEAAGAAAGAPATHLQVLCCHLIQLLVHPLQILSHVFSITARHDSLHDSTTTAVGFVSALRCCPVHACCCTTPAA
jgi:hypothetical protein